LLESNIFNLFVTITDHDSILVFVTNWYGAKF